VPLPAHVTHRIAALRENAFELHATLSALLRESDEEREQIAHAAVGIQSVANQLGVVEAVLAPHHLVAVRR
jgi:hypothetical protein